MEDGHTLKFWDWSRKNKAVLQRLDAVSPGEMTLYQADLRRNRTLNFGASQSAEAEGKAASIHLKKAIQSGRFFYFIHGTTSIRSPSSFIAIAPA